MNLTQLGKVVDQFVVKSCSLSGMKSKDALISAEFEQRENAKHVCVTTINT